MMKNVYRAMFVLFTMAAITGCGGNAEPGAAPIGEREPRQAVAQIVSMPEPAETTIESVKISIGSEPDSFDPMISAATDTQSTVLLNVYEGLLHFNESGEFIPGLASSWSVSLDGLTYTFDLKPGIQFHNGDIFSSADVKFTYDRLAGLDSLPPANETISQLIASVEAPDDSTVSISLHEPNAGFATKLIVPIVPKDYTDAASIPIGTGPYKFVEYIPGQKIVLERNDNYNTSTERVPSIDTVEFKIMTDANARLMALKSGDLDITSVTASNIPALEGQFQVLQAPSNTVQVMGLNNLAAPLNNILVRQAINYAVNKEEIIAGAFSGSGTRVDSFLSPIMAYYYNFDMDVYETDIEKAKELLAQAGYADGFEITITVPSNYQMHVDTAQIVQSQLEKAGIRAEIQLVEWAGWLENVYNGRDYEITIIGHTGKLDPNDFLNRFDSTYANNYFNFSNTAYDEMIEEAASATDEAKRAAIFKECQQMLVDEAASVFIHDPSAVTAISQRIDGYKTYPISFYDLASLRIN